jgi:DNA adenine methylase
MYDLVTMTKAGTADKMVSSPIKWAGGKSRLRKKIIPLIPAHTCYVEPFGGGAWVLLGKKPSMVEVYNDIDGELVNFFRIVKQNPQGLIDAFEWEIVSREQFDTLADADLRAMTDIERAHRLFYILMAGWGGELNYPRLQTSIKDGGHGNRLIGALKTLEKRIRPVHERLRTVIVENLDWSALIDRYDSATTVFYIDPPYPGNGVNYKHNLRNWEDHQRLAERLSRTEGKWIISSYDKPEVRELYGAHHHIIPVESSSGMATADGGEGRVANKEILVCNFVPTESQMQAAGVQEPGNQELFPEAV